jgi:hypothetical protein
MASKPKPNNRWDASHGTYIAGRAALDGVDHLAATMERKWGAGRLRLLVTAEWREKFDRQRYKLRRAIEQGPLPELQNEAARMEAAWTHLDYLATYHEAPVLAPLVWEIALPDGTVAALCYDHADAAAVDTDGRTVVVYSLDELANIIHQHRAQSLELRPPRHFVEPIRRNLDDPLDAIGQAGDFDDPLDAPGLMGAG